MVVERCFVAAVLALVALLTGSASIAQDARQADYRQCSPGGTLCFELELVAGIATYAVERNGQPVVAPSKLGFLLRGAGKWEHGMKLGEPTRRRHRTTWEQPWGESRLVVNAHNEISVPITEQGKTKRAINLVARVFDDGVGFRFEFPEQPQLEQVRIDEELTEFVIAGDAEAWWIPGGEWNRYEYLYNRTPANEVGTAHTPITFRREDGLHIAIHEAALADYSAFWLQRIDGQRFRTRLAPSSQPWKVEGTAPFATPWRTILVADDAPKLYAAADILLNLNDDQCVS